MIGLDSWIFLEYYSFGPKRNRCEKLIFNRDKKLISTVVLMEVIYKSMKKLGRIKTKEIVRDITSSTSTILVDVDRNVAEKAAELRLKYYKKGRELSYSDCIHLATAILSKCRKFYSGDPDFEDVKEIPIGII